MRVPGTPLLPESARVCQYHFEFLQPPIRLRDAPVGRFPGNTKDQRSGLQHTNLLPTTGYELSAVPLTGGAPALDKGEVTEWLGHQASPGTSDTISITVSNGYYASRTLTRGDIRIY